MDYKHRIKLPVRRVQSLMTAKRGSLVIGHRMPILPSRQKRELPRTLQSSLRTFSNVQPRSSVKPVVSNRPKIQTTKAKNIEVRNNNSRIITAIRNSYSDRINSLRNSGEGKTLIMIACGPTVNEVDFSKLLNNPKIDIMTINKPLDKVWPPKYWCFCDMSQYNRNKEKFNEFNTGLILTTTGISPTKANQIKITAKKGSGWSYDMVDGFFIGRSSTYAYMQVALWMNYISIYVFGLDMAEDPVTHQLHYYGVNPDVDPTNRKTRFAGEAKSYEFAGQTLPEAVRKRYTICSSLNPFSFVNYFNRLDHKVAVEKILESIK